MWIQSVQNAAAKQLFKKINEINKGFRNVSGSKVAAGFDVELLHIAQKMDLKIKKFQLIGCM